MPWKQLSSRIAYQNHWISVREDQVIRPDGSAGIYGVVDTKPSVAIVALTPEDKIWLIGQERYTDPRFGWELPCGGSDGQDLLVAARRELQEETGLTAGEWTEVGFYRPMNGICTETAYTFVARQLAPTGRNAQEEEGIEKTRTASWEEVKALIAGGEMRDGQAIASLFQAALHLGWL